MDINQRIYTLYQKVVDLGYYNNQGDVGNMKSERFFNLLDEIGATKVLIMLRNDISSEFSDIDFVNEHAYECLLESFSVEEFPEIWI